MNWIDILSLFIYLFFIFIIVFMYNEDINRPRHP